ncbi:L-idonate 5-dehydrogenase [Zeimonas arvi]|uniref:L-idonate 5-dehydrogenase n=1 Tax=Zeimonas arvi TaxID=2498847 RepID=A0A5C8P5L7_9BURK|nr:L-idonate 5-dehydrogenase [Zeimonas arvi]TXL68830.1 L-idonate 5-dehydrogenase [Zeimonas arvi]
MLECKVHGAEDLRIIDSPMPSPAAGEVLVKLGAAGICGSDLHYYLHGRVGNFVIREPLTPGHEASGIVAAVGAGVTRVEEGDRIAINPSSPCGKCPACREGRENLCHNVRFLGSASVFPHMQGMFREYFTMPESQCVKVTNDAVSLGEIAMSEPLSVALHSANRAGNLLGKSVLITGSGTIGCMQVIACRLAGASRIAITDVVDHPLSVARQVGADQALRVDQLPAGTTVAAAAGGEFDVAFEVSGAPQALGACLESVRRGGVVVQVGTLPAEGIHLHANLVMSREIDLRGSFRFGNVFELAVAAITSRRVDVRPVISGEWPLQKAAEAIQTARDKTRSMKVQLVAA